MNIQAFGRQVISGNVDAVDIVSNEGDIYTAQAIIAGQVHTLETDSSHHQPLVFHSYIEAKRSLGGYRVPIRLKPSEVYDEMISH